MCLDLRAHKRARPLAQPILKGQPHPPVRGQSIREAEQLHAALQRGEEPEEGIVDALAVFGRAAYVPAVPLVERLLNDPDVYVRTYALQTLVLDFHLPQHFETAWRMLGEETHYELRSMAASCLGFCYTTTRDLPLLQWMAALVADHSEDPMVRTSAYAAIFDIVGYPYRNPKRPPFTWAANFRNEEVDWELISQIKHGEVPPAPDE